MCLDSGCTTTTGCGSRRRSAAWSPAALRSTSSTRGCTRATAGGVVPSSFRIAAPAARPHRGRARPASCCSRSCTSRSPPTGSSRRMRRPRELGPLAGARSVRRRRAAPPPTTRSSCCSPARWRPALASSASTACRRSAAAGNVLRPSTTLKLSFRLPPTADPDARADAPSSERSLADPPYGARVSDQSTTRTGWNAPPPAPWLAAALDEASVAAFGAAGRACSARAARSRSWACSASASPTPSSSSPACSAPDANAHGPNEFLHLPDGPPHHRSRRRAPRHPRPPVDVAALRSSCV